MYNITKKEEMGFLFAAQGYVKKKKLFCRQRYSNCKCCYNINKPSLPFFEHLLTALWLLKISK